MDIEYLAFEDNNMPGGQHAVSEEGKVLQRNEQDSSSQTGPIQASNNSSNSTVNLGDSPRCSDVSTVLLKEPPSQSKRRSSKPSKPNPNVNSKLVKIQNSTQKGQSRNLKKIPSTQLINQHSIVDSGPHSPKNSSSSSSSCKTTHMSERDFSDTLNYSFDSIGLPAVRQKTLPSKMIAPGKTTDNIHIQQSHQQEMTSAAQDSCLAHGISASIEWLSSQLPLYSQDPTVTMGSSQDQVIYPHPTIIEPFSGTGGPLSTQAPSETTQQQAAAVELYNRSIADLISLPQQHESNVRLDACRLLYSLAEQVGSSTQIKVHRLQQLHNKGKSMYLNRQRKFLWPAPRDEMRKSWLFDSQELLRTSGHDYLADYEDELEIQKDEEVSDESYSEDEKIRFTPSQNSFPQKQPSLGSKRPYSAFECDQQTRVLSNDSFLVQQVLYEIDRISKQQLNLSKDTKLLIARDALDMLEKVLVECSEMHHLIDEKQSSSTLTTDNNNVAGEKQRLSKRVTNRKMDWRSIVHSMSYANPENPNLANRVEARMREYTHQHQHQEDSLNH